MPFGPRDLIELDTDLSTLKKLPGWPGYYINEAGEVFTVRRLSPYRDRDGYWRINSGRLKKAIHRLLAIAFLPPPGPGQNEVRHLDGNRQNNALSNLAWGTRQENASDMARHGTLKGQRNVKAQLYDHQVIMIRDMLFEGKKTVAEIAAHFGVSVPVIKAIKSRQNWKHIKGQLEPEDAA